MKEEGEGDNPVQAAHREGLIPGQKRLLEMIARGTPHGETLNAVINFIESQAPEMTCTILLLDEGRLWAGAGPNFPPGLTAAINGSEIGPVAGSCGTAAFRGENVFVQDISVDPLWAEYKNVFLLHGFRACWSSPIFDEQHHVLGTFAMYYRTAALPSKYHLELIDIATHIAAICLTRKRAEETLARSQQQLALIYDTVTDVIFLLEVLPEFRFRFVSVNKAFLTATGLRAEQVIGKHVEKVIPPSSHQLVFAKYRQAMEDKRPVQWEEVSVYPTGKKTAIVTVSPVFDDKGVCTNLVGAVHDVTEFRKAEEAVRKSQLELEHIYSTAPVGLALLDENLRYVRINERVATILEKRPEEVIGKTVFEILPEVAENLRGIYRSVLETGQPILDVEVSGAIETQPNIHRTWLANYYPVKFQGKVKGVGIVVIEITDRVAAAEFGQLAIGDTDLSRLLESMQRTIERSLHTELISVWELMPDAKNLSPRAAFGWKTIIPPLSAGTESQAGYTILRDEPVVVEDVNRETRFTIPPFFIEQGVASSMTVLIPGKKGPYGVLGTYTTTRRDFSPHQVHFLQSIANILGAFIERKKLEEQIFQSQKMELIGRLAAGVAHQLNTPLAVIMMRLQMLKEDLASVADSRSLEQLESIVTSSKKMSTIIQDLLGFSRVSNLQKETVEIETLLNQILSFVEVRANKLKVKLKKDFSSNLISLEADKNRLEQAFLNIVVNALDAMSGGGTLSIHTDTVFRGENHLASIEFHDTGHGISKEDSARVFDPFFTTKSVGEGTGLGLTVTYEIIRSHGGEIDFQSSPGDGTTFRVLLPCH